MTTSTAPNLPISVVVTPGLTLEKQEEPTCTDATATTTDSEKKPTEEEGPFAGDGDPSVPLQQQQPQQQQLHSTTTQQTALSSSSNIKLEEYDDNVHLTKTTTTTAEGEKFILPPCELPTRKELEPVEMFVSNAIKEQNTQTSVSNLVVGYRGIIEAFRSPNKDYDMLRMVMIAIRTSSSTLSLLTNNSSNQHNARLIHQIVKFNPFPPKTCISTYIYWQKRQEEEQMLEEQKDNDVDNDDDGNDDKNNNYESRTIEDNDDNDDSEETYKLPDAYLHLMVALVTSNSVFLIPVLSAIWKLLHFKICSARPRRLQRLHAALATIIRLCPKARTELFSILSSQAPFRLRIEPVQSFYYRQCLYVLQYLPSIRPNVIELIVDRCLELDVEIKITDHGEATIDDDDKGDSISGNDDEVDGGGIFQLDLDDDEKKEKPQQHQVAEKKDDDSTVDEMADKLDALMHILLEYIDQSVGDGLELYQLLARIFESSILITHKSKFVQFLIFHICGLEARQLTGDPAEEAATLYREFAAKLIDVVLDPYRATVTRQSGACYLASFVSRASFVCVETTCEAVDALLRYAEAYIDSLGPISIHASDSREQCNLHSLFYTICQAAFYIMCFRGVEVIRHIRCTSGQDDSDEQLTYLNLDCDRWTKLCKHSLSPLRHCLESVRSEFLRLSQIFSLIDESVLQRLLCGEEGPQSSSYAGRHRNKKKRVTLITTAATLEKERLRGGVGGLGRGTNPLDSFFPFDPYLLHQSNRFIELHYRHWDGGASEEDVPNSNNESGEAGVSSADEDEEVASIHGSTQGDDSDDSESEDDDDDDDDVLENNAERRSRLLSYASNATSISSHPETLGDTTGISPEVIAKKAELNEAWKQSLKRARAPSIENGSW